MLSDSASFICSRVVHSTGPLVPLITMPCHTTVCCLSVCSFMYSTISGSFHCGMWDRGRLLVWLALTVTDDVFVVFTLVWTYVSLARYSSRILEVVVVLVASTTTSCVLGSAMVSDVEGVSVSS